MPTPHDHTKTPYRMTLKASCGLILDALTGVTIADCRNESDAAEIVSRCNSHDELLEACRHSAKSNHHPACKCRGEYLAFPEQYCTCHVQKARNAVAHAEGRD